MCPSETSKIDGRNMQQATLFIIQKIYISLYPPAVFISRNDSSVQGNELFQIENRSFLLRSSGKYFVMTVKHTHTHTQTLYMYIYIYTHIHTHTHTRTLLLNP